MTTATDNNLVEFVPNRLWYKRIPLSYLGVPIGTRMTVVRLNSDSLFIHSPVRLDDLTRAQLDRLGNVAYVVSPNNMHHFFIGEYFAVYPSAKIFASPGLPEKRTDLKFHYMLSDSPEPEWSEHLDQMMFLGHPLLREIVFFHKQSGTLIVADLIVNFQDDSHPITKFVTRLGGIYSKPTPPMDFRLSVEEHAFVRHSLERIMQWDFNKIILAHGRIIEQNGKEVLKDAFSWVFDKQRGS